MEMDYSSTCEGDFNLYFTEYGENNTNFLFLSNYAFMILFILLQPDQELALDSALSVSSPLIDCERTLGLLLGLYACHLAHSTPVTIEEDEYDRWLTADFFSGGMETSSAPAYANVGK